MNEYKILMLALKKKQEKKEKKYKKYGARNLLIEKYGKTSDKSFNTSFIQDIVYKMLLNNGT